MPSCLLKFIDPCWDTGNPPSGYLPGTVVAGTPPFAMAIPVVSAAQPDYREVRFCLTGAVHDDTNRVETSVFVVPEGWQHETAGPVWFRARSTWKQTRDDILKEGRDPRDSLRPEGL